MEYRQPISFLEVLKTGVFCSKGYKNTRPLDKRQQNANIDVSGNVCNEIWKNTHYSKKMDQLLFFQHHPPYQESGYPPHGLACHRVVLHRMCPEAGVLRIEYDFHGSGVNV
jgi:hypothetical protein